MQTSSYLYIVAFVGGAVVLALEILGTRVLGPFYGVSLFLWSALISITLAALSLGYALGGKWADKNPKLHYLILLLAGSGILTLAIPWLKYPVLSWTEPFGLRGAVLVASFVLFFPPLTLLGMVSPFVIKLRAQSLDEVGRSAGNLYAVSTLGSVVAGLMTGFILIPNIGVHRLLLSLSGVLFLTAAYGLFVMRKPRGAIVTALGIPLALLLPANDGPDKAGLVGVFQSPYAELRIVDTEAGRHMLIDGGIHTLMDTATGKALHPYVAVMETPQFLMDKPGDLLLIGLGGGSLVKSYACTGWKIDAVEIDERVAQLAYKFFRLDSSEATIHITDGRQYLQSNEKLYDLILIDAFGSSSIPFHLVTTEAFALIASRLKPGGLIAINVETVGWRHDLVLSLGATLRQHLEFVLALPMAEPPNTIGNLILLASRSPFNLRKELPRDYHDPEYRHGEQYRRNHAWDNQFVPDTDAGEVITDDLNPVDLWSEEVNFVARKDLHEYFGKAGTGW